MAYPARNAGHQEPAPLASGETALVEEAIEDLEDVRAPARVDARVHAHEERVAHDAIGVGER